jgi:sialic acid synthase SpsE
MSYKLLTYVISTIEFQYELSANSAVALGAVCIEKHITLDCGMSGPDHKSSIEPDEF